MAEAALIACVAVAKAEPKCYNETLCGSDVDAIAFRRQFGSDTDTDYVYPRRLRLGENCLCMHLRRWANRTPLTLLC